MTGVELAPFDPVAIVKRTTPERAEDILQLFDDDELVPLAVHVEETQLILKAFSGQMPNSKEDEVALVALIGRAYKVEKAMETLLKARLAPLQTEERLVRGVFKALFDQLYADMGKKGKAEGLLFAWRRVEADRIRREQEEALRKQEEAARTQAAAEAAATAAKTEEERKKALAAAEEASRAQAQAELTTPRAQNKGVRTEDGSVGYTGVMDAEIVNVELVPRDYWRHPDMIEALVKVIKRAVRSGVRAIPGVNIFPADGLRRSAK